MERELYHHGIKGMHWGIRRTAAQLGHVVKSSTKKVSDTVNTVKERNREARREKVIKSRSASELYKNADLFSDSELVVLRNRLSLEKSLKDLSKQNSAGEKYIKSAGKIATVLGTTASVVGNGSKLYDNIARVLNAKNSSDPSKKKLPIVGGDGSKKKK